MPSSDIPTIPVSGAAASIWASTHRPASQASLPTAGEEGGEAQQRQQQPIDQVPLVTSKTSPTSNTGEPMSWAEDMSVALDEDHREVFMKLRQRYLNLLQFVNYDRWTMLTEIKEKKHQTNVVQESTLKFPPEQRRAVQVLLSDSRAKIEEQQRILDQKLSAVENERAVLRNDLTYGLHALPGEVLYKFVREFQWPTIEACHDLGLPYDYSLMINGMYVPVMKPTEQRTTAPNEKSSEEVIRLRQRIATLEEQATRLTKQPTTTLTTTLSEQPKKANGGYPRIFGTKKTSPFY